MKKTSLIFSALIGITMLSCSTDEPIENPNAGPRLNITFIMDADAERLDNLGNPVSVPEGNAAQDPDFDVLGLHFIGLYPDKFTPYDEGVTVVSTATTGSGGATAIDFDSEVFFNDELNTLSVPLSFVSTGTYEYFRASIGYQKYRIVYNLEGAETEIPDWPANVDDNIDVDGVVASFLGYNTYIGSYVIDKQTVSVNGNKAQGYFGLETTGEIEGFVLNQLTQGEAPQTTVPNPIDDTSPVPEGSCVVTGQFPSALVIPQNPTEDINVEIVISINQSFEWEDGNGNGKYEPLLGETVVDMGTRGVFPSVVD
tara:strand:- start:187676 stop:188611 length:936 start_codon:yes stop_codon:yes gene_type:complete